MSKGPGWKDTLRALRDRRMLFLLLLGFSSGLPFALTLGTLQAWMRDLQIDLKTIGLFAFLRLPFSLKFLWAPLMDRYSWPFLDRRRSWAVISQVAITACLVGMVLVDPLSQIHWLVALTLGVNFFAASQDIVLDAYRREVLEDRELGLGSSVFINGYIVAFRYVSGALALFLAGETIGWSYPQVYALMAMLMGLMVVVSFLAPKISVEFSAPRSLKEAFVGPLQEYFSRPGAWGILAFIVLYKVGDNMAGTMTLPFLKDVGFTNDQYVAIVKAWGPAMTFVGSLIGGHLVYQFGIMPSLWVMGILQALSTALFAVLTHTGPHLTWLAVIVAFENITAQMGTAAYAAYMGSITNRQFTATQYALLSSLMAVPGALFGSRTGAMAESLGWYGFFIACAVVAIPGLLMIALLKEGAQAKHRVLNGFFVVSVSLGILYSTGTSLMDLVALVARSFK
jgi:PAT family beta-lactamase induction signal transducer AmpG